LGDVIGAQSIFDCGLSSGSLPLSFIERLLAVPPRREKIRPGTRAALYLPDIGKIELTFRHDGRIVARVGPYQKLLNEDDDEFPSEMYAELGER
jgi:hypothetical protein